MFVVRACEGVYVQAIPAKTETTPPRRGWTGHKKHKKSLALTPDFAIILIHFVGA